MELIRKKEMVCEMRTKGQKGQAESGRVVRHSIPGNILFWLGIYWKWAPGVVLLGALELVLGALVPLVGIYLPKLVLDLLAGHVTAAALIRVLGLWGLMAAVLYGVKGGLNGKYFVQNSVRSYLMPELFLKSLRVSYEIPESEWGKKAYQEALGVAAGGDWSASTRTFDVLGVLSPWIVLGLVALSMLNILVIEKGLRFEDSMREREAVHGRHWNYILSAMGNMTAAKDVRIFGMHSWLGSIRDRVAAGHERTDRSGAGCGGLWLPDLQRVRRADQCERFCVVLWGCDRFLRFCHRDTVPGGRSEIRPQCH